MSAGPQQHLYSPGGFLDDTWWHRYYMVYGTRFKNGPGGGIGRSGGAPYGRILVCDGKHVYGYGRARKTQYHLFRSTTAIAKPAPKGGRKARGKGGAPAGTWSDPAFPVMVRAMLLAGGAGGAGRLVVAGPPAEALTDVGVLRGGKGGIVAVVDAGTGKILSQVSVDARPVFDGLCAARGRVVMSLTSAKVVAFK
jgi:hypothetical protein